MVPSRLLSDRALKHGPLSAFPPAGDDSSATERAETGLICLAKTVHVGECKPGGTKTATIGFESRKVCCVAGLVVVC